MLARVQVTLGWCFGLEVWGFGSPARPPISGNLMRVCWCGLFGCVDWFAWLVWLGWFGLAWLGLLVCLFCCVFVALFGGLVGLFCLFPLLCLFGLVCEVCLAGLVGSVCLIALVWFRLGRCAGEAPKPSFWIAQNLVSNGKLEQSFLKPRAPRGNYQNCRQPNMGGYVLGDPRTLCFSLHNDKRRVPRRKEMEPHRYRGP